MCIYNASEITSCFLTRQNYNLFSRLPILAREEFVCLSVCVCVPIPCEGTEMGEGAAFILFCLKTYFLIGLYIQDGFIMVTLAWE